jgi:acetyl-CoA/propionyl-CoA carboxylase biotin carboxyl carrier protein
VRVDAAVETGSVVGTDYDSMIAKVIAHGPDRATALARLDRALADTAILGLTTNTGFLRGLLAHEGVRAGEMDTGLIGRLEPVEPPLSEQDVARAAAAIALAVAAERAGDDPFERRDGWRLGGTPARSYWKLAVDGGEPFDVALEPAAVERIGETTWRVGRRRFTFARDGRAVWLGYAGWAWHVTEATAEDIHHAHADGELRAPMPGSVLLVPRSVGDPVEAGQTVVVLESMKMELALTAPVDGTVTVLTVSVGDKVARDEVVAKIEAAA